MNMDFNKQHLRNAIRTLRRYMLVKIEEHYANSLGADCYYKWIGKIKDYKIISYQDLAECKLLLHIQSGLKKHEIEFYIPYDSEVIYGDVRKGEPYIIDYINSGPHCQYTFKRVI